MWLLKTYCTHRRALVVWRDSGLGDNLLQAAWGWYYAKQTGRALIILWTRSRYLRDKRVNAFTQWFRLPPVLEGVPVQTDPLVDRFSTLLISNHHLLLPAPDILQIGRKLLTLARSRQIRSWRHTHWDPIAESAQGLIRESKDTKQRVLVTTQCYPPDEKIKPFFDALDQE